MRKFLIAYNINLVSTKEQAHRWAGLSWTTLASRIALNLRSKGRGPGQEGRLGECQGIGWWLQESNIAQVQQTIYFVCFLFSSPDKFTLLEL